MVEQGNTAFAAAASTEDLADSNFIVPIRRLPSRLKIDVERSKEVQHIALEKSTTDLLDDSDAESWEDISTPDTITRDRPVPSVTRDGPVASSPDPAQRDLECLDFWDAICRGDCETVTTMLNRNMSVWQSDEHGLTPLVMAITAGDEQMMLLLLDHGASVHQTVSRMPPLMHAISKKHDTPRLMNLLLDRGANLNVVLAAEKLTALHLAASRGVVDAVDFLASRNMDLEQRDSRGRTALMIAAENGHLTTVKVLIAKGADIRIQSHNGRTAMMWGANNGHVDVVRYFLDQGLGVDDVDGSGITTLSILSCFGSVEGVKMMLDRGADVNGGPIEPRYFTPVMVAATENHREVMEILIERDANLALTQRNGDTALDLQLALGRLDTTRLLLKGLGGISYPTESVALQIAAADTSHATSTAIMATASIMYTKLASFTHIGTNSWVNWVLEEGGHLVKPYAMRNMMKTAIKNHQPDVVKMLLWLGFEPDQHIGGGHTALTMAIHFNRVDLVRILLDGGADPAFLACGEEIEDMTPLYHAIVALDNDLDKDTSMVDALLATGRCKLMKGPSLQKNAFGYILSCYHDWTHNVAEILTFRMLKSSINVHTDRANDGASLLHAAVFNNHKDLVGIILEMGADINTRDKYGRTPFFAAMPMPRFHPDNTDMMRYLIEKGADPFAIAKDGQTALHINVSFPFNPKAVKFLLDTGLNIDKPKNSGHSPLAWAVDHGREDTALLLLEHGARITTNKLSGDSTLLHFAVAQGMPELLCRIIEANVIDVNAKDCRGYTPLLRALKRNGRQCSDVYLTIVKTLLDAGADIEHPTVGDRALHLALIAGHESIAELLLQRGADAYATGYERGTPLHLAVEYRCHKIVEILLERGVDIEARDDMDQTPIFFADDKISVEALVKHGANVNAVDKHGWTPLHIAVKALDAPVFRALLAAGADLDAKTPDDGMSVRDRILALVGENWRCAFFRCIMQCSKACAKINKHERDFMERRWKKWLVLNPRSGQEEFRIPNQFVTDEVDENR